MDALYKGKIAFGQLPLQPHWCLAVAGGVIISINRRLKISYRLHRLEF